MNRRAFTLGTLASLLVPGGLGLFERPAPHDIELPAPAWVPHLVTFYCPCDICCGYWIKGYLVIPATGVTTTGRRPVEGLTVAADLRLWKLGTRIDIQGIGQRTVGDAGPMGYHLDVFVDSHKRAVSLGFKWRGVRAWV